MLRHKLGRVGHRVFEGAGFFTLVVQCYSFENDLTPGVVRDSDAVNIGDWAALLDMVY